MLGWLRESKQWFLDGQNYDFALVFRRKIASYDRQARERCSVRTFPPPEI